MISGNEQATEQFYADRIGRRRFHEETFPRFEVFAGLNGSIPISR